MSNNYVESGLLIGEAKKNETEFNNVLEASASFEIKGVLNSEMLLFVTLIDLLGVKHVIESGRARAQSTEIIARWLAGKEDLIQFDSIEFDADSDDVTIAESRVRNSGYPVNLYFGDAFELLPKILNENDDKKIILVDGPKGIDAVALAIEALGKNKVEAVCIHDIHKDDERLRSLVERHWPTVFASDNKTYIDAFRHMDEPCWAEHQKYHEFRGWGPYKRGERVMKSYGPTLICLINSISEEKYTEARGVFRKEKASVDRKRFFIKCIGCFLPETIKHHPKVRKVAKVILSR